MERGNFNLSWFQGEIQCRDAQGTHDRTTLSESTSSMMDVNAPSTSFEDNSHLLGFSKMRVFCKAWFGFSEYVIISGLCDS